MTIEFRYYNISVAPGSNVLSEDPDMILDNLTGFKTLSGIARIKQELVKITMTGLNDDFMDPEYGSKLVTSIGAPARSTVLVAVEDAVRSHITKLIAIQSADATRTDDEIISSIDKILVNFDPIDRRNIIVDATVTTVHGTPVVAQLPITVGG